MAQKYAKLVMVTENNNNKYYEMTYDGGANFAVKYGRVESTAVSDSYPIGMWDKKYNEKVKKGYVDVTHTVSVKVDTKKTDTTVSYSKHPDALVHQFITLMKNYTDKLVSTTYSVQAKDVTQAQVDEAQGYLDTLSKLSKDKKINTKSINEHLLKLYTVIPRYMSRVPDYLLPSISLAGLLQKEQDNLDAMASQVAQLNPKKDAKKAKRAQTLLDDIGVTMKETKPTKEIEYLIKQLTGRKIAGLLEVNKPQEDATFNKWMKDQKDKTTKILIHGTRCASVIPILEIGLKIRPQGNFQFSGKAYGDGNYFSEVTNKSLGYCGYDNDKVLLVYEVHTGNPFKYNGWYTGNSFELSYKELSKRGFDSTHVSAGNGLLNSEIIAYKEQQNRIKYIIWLK